jgi:hypothetical protein
MGLHNELPVYKACYDLLIEIFQFTKEFSKDFKYTAGESLKNETIELSIMVFKMNNCIEPNETLTKGLPQGWLT